MARPRLSEAKKRDILKLIESLEESVRKAKEYLASGKHANWVGFQPLFVSKPQHRTKTG